MKPHNEPGLPRGPCTAALMGSAPQVTVLLPAPFPINNMLLQPLLPQHQKYTVINTLGHFLALYVLETARNEQILTFSGKGSIPPCSSCFHLNAL